MSQKWKVPKKCPVLFECISAIFLHTPWSTFPKLWNKERQNKLYSFLILFAFSTLALLLHTIITIKTIFITLKEKRQFRMEFRYHETRFKTDFVALKTYPLRGRPVHVCSMHCELKIPLDNRGKYESFRPFWLSAKKS